VKNCSHRPTREPTKISTIDAKDLLKLTKITQLPLKIQPPVKQKAQPLFGCAFNRAIPSVFSPGSFSVVREMNYYLQLLS
jgi:hypothetical protein